jgi:hypothetical protein
MIILFLPGATKAKQAGGGVWPFWLAVAIKRDLLCSMSRARPFDHAFISLSIGLVGVRSKISTSCGSGCGTRGAAS